MSHKLWSRVDEYTGIRFGLAGLGIAALGAALAFTFAPTAGYWIGVVGVLTALCGIALHWAKNWRRIFGVHHE